MKAFLLGACLFVVVRALWRRQDQSGQPHAESGMLAVWIGIFGFFVFILML